MKEFFSSVLTLLSWKGSELVELGRGIGKVFLAIIGIIIAIFVGIGHGFWRLLCGVWWLVIHIPTFLKWIRHVVPTALSWLGTKVWTDFLPGIVVAAAIYALGWVIPALDAASLTKWGWRAAVPVALWAYWNVLAVTLRGSVIAESDEDDDIAADGKRLRNACLRKAAANIAVSTGFLMFSAAVVTGIIFAPEILVMLTIAALSGLGGLVLAALLASAY